MTAIHWLLLGLIATVALLFVVQALIHANQKLDQTIGYHLRTEDLALLNDAPPEDAPHSPANPTTGA